MSVMIQIRDVPDSLHRKLKARAALAGKSLSTYLLDELRHASETPTRAEILARIKARPAMVGGPQTADVLREDRDR